MPRVSELTVLGLIGLLLGLFLLVRGLRAFQRSRQISDVATSRIASLAAGEVRVSGLVELDALSLISPLQSATCVYYRSVVRDDQDRTSSTVFEDERSVGFSLRDETGMIRVLPRGARWFIPERFTGRTGIMGEEPPGLSINRGSRFGTETLSREQQIAALLTVRTARPDAAVGDDDVGWDRLLVTPASSLAGGGRSYSEARVEPGDILTVIAAATPFGELPEYSEDPLSALDDPEVAADLAAAREAGALETSSAEAWGNAAIPGFGIGQPIRPPALDPSAPPAVVVDPTSQPPSQARERLEIPSDALILAGAPDRLMLIHAGTPHEAAARQTSGFYIGMGGALLAIASTLVLAFSLGGRP